MAEQMTIPASERMTFKEFLFKDKRNRMILILAGITIVVQWSVFKYFYPFASFIHGDSFNYLETAYHNFDVNTYLVGYARFLRLFSVLTSSDLALTSFQYLLLESSALLLLFTVNYFYRIGKIILYILSAFILFNPLFLHLGNLVSSDCFFVALSLLWFVLMLWIIYKPTTQIVIWHGIILFIAFTVRYNALIYPLISIVAYFLSPISIKRKFMGMVLGFLLCGSFMTYTSYKFKRLTGVWQYAPFSGWQLTNNAMYAYKYVDSIDRKPVPKRFHAFDNMVRQYFDTTRDTKRFPYEAIQASTVYMWTRGLPMYKYRDSLFNLKGTMPGELKKWASMGPFFKNYGTYIIKQYPLHYVQYFLWPNFKKYYAPPVEFLEAYNSGKDSVSLVAKTWFGYKNGKVSVRTKDKDVNILNFYPIWSGMINIIMAFLIICYLILKGWRYKNNLSKYFILGTTVWLFNASFTIIASPAALRFQTFPIIITTLSTFLLIDWMVQLLEYMKHNSPTVYNMKREKELSIEY